MPGVRGVLVAVAPFPASIGAGQLGAAQRGCLLADLAECYGKLIVCHLRDPLRCRLAVCAAWRGWCAGRRGGGPGSGMQSRYQPTPRRTRCPKSAKPASGIVRGPGGGVVVLAGAGADGWHPFAAFPGGARLGARGGRRGGRPGHPGGQGPPVLAGLAAACRAGRARHRGRAGGCHCWPPGRHGGPGLRRRARVRRRRLRRKATADRIAAERDRGGPDVLPLPGASPSARAASRSTRAPSRSSRYRRRPCRGWSS